MKYYARMSVLFAAALWIGAGSRTFADAPTPPTGSLATVGTAGGSGGGKSACRQDAEKLCANEPAGHGARMHCLEQHQSQLSSACQGEIAQMKQHHGGSMEVCAQDRQKFCANVQPGGGRGIKCMKEHLSELTPACRQAFEAKLQEHHAAGQGGQPPMPPAAQPH